MFVYDVTGEMTRARLHEGQRFAMVGRDDICDGAYDKKKVVPHHHDLLSEFWAGRFNVRGITQ